MENNLKSKNYYDVETSINYLLYLVHYAFNLFNNLSIEGLTSLNIKETETNYIFEFNMIKSNKKIFKIILLEIDKKDEELFRYLLEKIMLVYKLYNLKNQEKKVYMILSIKNKKLLDNLYNLKIYNFNDIKDKLIIKQRIDYFNYKFKIWLEKIYNSTLLNKDLPKIKAYKMYKLC